LRFLDLVVEQEALQPSSFFKEEGLGGGRVMGYDMDVSGTTLGEQEEVIVL